MIVVADTSPVNYLVRCGCAWVLPELFGRVLVPPAVVTEMLHSRSPNEVREFASSPPAWLECVAVHQMLPEIDPQLGAGEREAICLALETHADALLIDERRGRREAQAHNVAARGTVAVLLQAGIRGYIDFPESLSKLVALGFRISDSLRDAALDEFRQRRSG